MKIRMRDENNVSRTKKINNTKHISPMKTDWDRSDIYDDIHLTKSILTG